MKEKEIHFIQIEGIVEKRIERQDNGGFFSFAKFLMRFYFESIDKSFGKIQEWVVTDFDHHLLGNPHTPFKENI